MKTFHKNLGKARMPSHCLTWVQNEMFEITGVHKNKKKIMLLNSNQQKHFHFHK